MIVFMVSKAYIAMIAFGHPTTRFAFDKRREAPPVLKKNHLLIIFQSKLNFIVQQRRKMCHYLLLPVSLLQIGDLNLREFNASMPSGQFNETILSLLGIKIGFYRRCRRSK